MKIVSIKTYAPRAPLGKERFYSSQCPFPQRNSLLTRIETDDGLVGWGEGGQYGPSETVAACIEHVLAPKVIGRSPHELGCIWEELYGLTRDFGQKGTYVEAISAIDIALWDLKGKALGVPVHNLLGGAFRDSISGYATGCYYRGENAFDHKAELENLAAEAKAYADSGFKMLKIKIGLLSVEADIERVAAIRDAIGPDMHLLADSNHAYLAPTAIRMGRALQDFGCLMFEEPVPPEDHDGYRTVRNALDIAVSGGECEFTRWGFRKLIAEGCVDIVQPDICASGGLSEFQKIWSFASAYGVPVMPHVWGSGVALSAALHALAAMPLQPYTANPIPFQNEPVIEFDRNPNPLRDELLQETIVLGEDGRVSVPQGPGLGIEIDESALARFCEG
jgi:D-galactarolactone cycloisomerase